MNYFFLILVVAATASDIRIPSSSCAVRLPADIYKHMTDDAKFYGSDIDHIWFAEVIAGDVPPLYKWWDRERPTHIPHKKLIPLSPKGCDWQGSPWFYSDDNTGEYVYDPVVMVSHLLMAVRNLRARVKQLENDFVLPYKSKML